MTTDKLYSISQEGIRGGIDLTHLCITLLLAITSWAALFPGLAENFTVPGGIVVMILINMVFDMFPFFLGAYVSGEIAHAHEKKMEVPEFLWVIAVGAMILHGGSAVITFQGANLVADLFANTGPIAAQIEAEESTWKMESTRAINAYNKAVAEERESRSSRIREMETAHAKALESLDAQRAAMQAQKYPKNAAMLSQKMAALTKQHNEAVAQIQNQPSLVQRPLLERGNTAGILTGQLEREAATNRRLATAMKFADVSSWFIMLLWFAALFMVPGLAGVSNITLWLLGWTFPLKAKSMQKAFAVERMMEAHSDEQLYEKAAVEEKAIVAVEKAVRKAEARFQEKWKDAQAEVAQREKEVWVEWAKRERELIERAEAEISDYQSRLARLGKEISPIRKPIEGGLARLENEENLASIGGLARLEKEISPIRKEGERRLETKKSIREMKPFMYHDKAYKDYNSFKGAMRGAKSLGDKGRYQAMKNYENQLLGIDTPIRKLV